jgi:hypothetical protein
VGDDPIINGEIIDLVDAILLLEDYATGATKVVATEDLLFEIDWCCIMKVGMPQSITSWYFNYKTNVEVKIGSTHLGNFYPRLR